MPIRFSTVAANADVLGDDTDSGSSEVGTPERVADGKPTGRPAKSPQRETWRGRSEHGSPRPGEDINAAGFIKDQDASKP